MVDQPTKPTEKPEAPRTPTNIKTDFEIWAKGRMGLTRTELAQNFADTHKLTPTEKYNLTEQIKGEEAEAIALEEAKKPPVPPQVQPAVKPNLIIKRTPYPKWWNDEGIAKISFSSPGSQFIVTARGDYSLYIATIVLTVSGECDITFSFGTAGSSGSMDFGGSDEPRGIVIAMGNSPTPCGSGSFMITATSDESVLIGGYVSYYLWKKEPTS